MKLTRLITPIILLALLSSSAFAQFEKEAGKVLIKNAMMPCAAGPGKIAFLRLDEKIPGSPVELFLSDLATGKETRLLPGTNFMEMPNPSYAVNPAGTEFVVPAKGGTGSWEMMKYAIGSSTPTRLGNMSQFLTVPSKEEMEALGLDPTSLLEITDLNWSPSGKKIIFTVVRAAGTSIWWIDVTSGRTRQATEDKLGYWGSFLPDDDRFCYTCMLVQESISSSEGLLVRSITTGKIDTLCNSKDSETAPAISPDGKYAAYNRMIDGTNNVWIVNLATKEARAITHSSNQKHCAYPKWSPDGKKLYFQGNEFLPQPVVFVKDFVPF